MSKMNINVPDSLLKQAQEVAAREDVTVDHLISTALAEKMSALLTVEYLRTRAARGDAHRFRQALGKVPDIEPDPVDRLQ